MGLEAALLVDFISGTNSKQITFFTNMWDSAIRCCCSHDASRIIKHMHSIRTWLDQEIILDLPPKSALNNKKKLTTNSENGIWCSKFKCIMSVSAL